MGLLDLSATFDTMDHSILLDILRWHFGIEGCALRWFSNYIQLRSQFVLIDSHSVSLFQTKVRGSTRQLPRASVLHCSC